MKLSKILLGIDHHKLETHIDFKNCSSTDNRDDLENEVIRLNFSYNGSNNHPLKWIAFTLPIKSNAEYIVKVLRNVADEIEKMDI